MDFDDIDPLDAAFANPKAGKKLKPGERLPGMEGGSTLDHAAIAPDAALSSALDDAFSARKFDASQEVAREALPDHDAALAAAAEEKLARSLDDAFANPKAGEKIASQTMHEGISPEQLGLTGYRPSATMDDMAAPKAGLFSPKFLVIGMLLAVVVIGFVVGGSADTQPSKPNVIRLID